MGCVNETEDFQLHSLGALVYFVGYDAYMVGRTARLLRISAAARACQRTLTRTRAWYSHPNPNPDPNPEPNPNPNPHSNQTRACQHPISLGVQAACAATSVLTTIARYAPRLCLASGLTATAAATTATASGLATLDPLTRVLDPVWPYP